MGSGPKKHLKRLNAPKNWMLDKLGGIWAPRPSQGPHRLRECLPVSLILRNRLKYALTRRETQMIVMRRHVAIDNKVRTDMNFPAGFMDVVSLEASNENFRILYDTKGRFVLHRIQKEEAAFKLVRVQSVQRTKKATSGKNPFLNGQQGAIPTVSTHDGRTVRFADPKWKVNDTLKFNLKTSEVEGHISFQVGALAMINGGSNIGRVGVITHIDKHPGSFDIVHVKDKRGNKFATRQSNIFVIGGTDEVAYVSLPGKQGVKTSILE